MAPLNALGNYNTNTSPRVLNPAHLGFSRKSNRAPLRGPTEVPEATLLRPLGSLSSVKLRWLHKSTHSVQISYRCTKKPAQTRWLETGTLSVSWARGLGVSSAHWAWPISYSGVCRLACFLVLASYKYLCCLSCQGWREQRWWCHSRSEIRLSILSWFLPSPISTIHPRCSGMGSVLGWGEEDGSLFCVNCVLRPSGYNIQGVPGIHQYHNCQPSYRFEPSVHHLCHFNRQLGGKWGGKTPTCRHMCSIHHFELGSQDWISERSSLLIICI